MALAGLLVVDKPSGMTSRAVVDRALGWFPRGTRLGHTGTLDPLAGGVLVLCVGKATRLGEYVQEMAKTYEAGFLLGARSDSDDADGEVIAVPVTQPPARDTIAGELLSFVGEIEQVPPAFSAAKVRGRRAYALARRGQEVALPARRVRIYRIDLVDYAYPHLQLLVHCGKGTYIRSLARDLGEKLGCGALVQTLRRTRVGPFDVAAAISLDADVETARAQLLPLALAVCDLPRLTLPADAIDRLRHGQALPLASELTADARKAAVFDQADTLAAIVTIDREQHLLKPEKVLAE